MNFLYRLYFFNSLKTGVKRDLYIASSCIDFMTKHKQPDTTLEGTRIQTNMPLQVLGVDDKMTIERYTFVSHVVDGAPESVNNIAFDGLFIKCTVQYLKDGGMKKYTSWINPNNISALYSFQPDCTELFFFSGQRVILANKLADIMTALKSHTQKYRETKNQKYGNGKK